MTHSIHHSDPIGFWENGKFNAKKVADFMDFKRSDVTNIANIKKSSVRYNNRTPEAVIVHLEKIAKICSMVAELLGNDINKTALWLNTPNPAIGDISPKQMMRYGRYEKLLKFVIQAKKNR